MEEPEQPIARKPKRREVVVVALLAALALGSATIWMKFLARRPDAASRAKRLAAQYVGEPTCRACHPGITAQQSRSGHARTLRLAKGVRIAAKLDGQTGIDRESPGTTFSYHLKEGVFSTTRQSLDASPEELLIQYALGSGTHATTFVTLNDSKSAAGGSLEHRLTHFSDAGGGRLDITPGQDERTNLKRGVKTPQGRALNAEETLKCFDCHATILSDRGPGRLDVESMVANVSCERCHGPGRAHVEAARKGETNLKMPFGEGRETASSELRMCGYCHRLPEMAPPGGVREDNLELVRFQPVGLMQSQCYKQSTGALRCTTCHDPHTKTSTDLAGYEERCLSCHSTTSKAVCSESSRPKTGCVGCHMPKLDAGQGILFSDHWIRVHDAFPLEKSKTVPPSHP